MVRDRSVLYPEFVDVFIYDASLSEEAVIEEIKDSVEPIVCEATSGETTDTVIDTSNNDHLGGNE